METSKVFSKEMFEQELSDTLKTAIQTSGSSIITYSPRAVEDGEWRQYTCSAHGWNKIPKPWKDMEVYVSAVDWWGTAHNPDLHFTKLGGQFDVSALRIGSSTHMTFISSESADKPMRVFGEFFDQWDHLWCLTNDSHTNDNVGGWILRTRKAR